MSSQLTVKPRPSRRKMPDTAFVNDMFMPLSEAQVSVEDRGFQFGDGVYELLRVYCGALFRPDEHLSRLERSATALGIPLPHSRDHWKTLLSDAVARSGYPEAKVYIQVTRGVAPRDHAPTQDGPPTVVVTVRAFAAPSPTLYQKGAEAITVPDLRWGRCDIKSICLLPNVLAKQRARAEHAFEALFVRDGYVVEGATSNVMNVKGGTIFTAPEGPLILSGVTRQLTLNLARAAGIAIKEQALTEPDFLESDEVFLTGTTIEVLPIRRINSRMIGKGSPGPLTAVLMEHFKALHV